jgi:hypothetical protein
MVAPAGRAQVCHCSPPEICAYARMLARLRGCFHRLSAVTGRVREFFKPLAPDIGTRLRGLAQPGAERPFKSSMWPSSIATQVPLAVQKFPLVGGVRNRPKSGGSRTNDIPDEKIPKDMLDLASHIVETKAGHFDPKKFDDRRPERREPAKVINLMDTLRRSVEVCLDLGEWFVLALEPSREFTALLGLACRRGEWRPN